MQPGIVSCMLQDLDSVNDQATPVYANLAVLLVNLDQWVATQLAPGSAIWHDGTLLVSWPARLYVSFSADWQQAVAQRCCHAVTCMTEWAQAGACFGLSAAACRTGFLLAARTSWLAAPAGLGASIAFTSAGFMLQVRPCLHPTL